jgi:hypothetical protein
VTERSAGPENFVCISCANFFCRKIWCEFRLFLPRQIWGGKSRNPASCSPAWRRPPALQRRIICAHWVISPDELRSVGSMERVIVHAADSSAACGYIPRRAHTGRAPGPGGRARPWPMPLSLAGNGVRCRPSNLASAFASRRVTIVAVLRFICGLILCRA